MWNSLSLESYLKWGKLPQKHWKMDEASRRDMKEWSLSQDRLMCHRCYRRRKWRRADCIMGNPTVVWLTKTICDELLSHLSAIHIVWEDIGTVPVNLQSHSGGCLSSEAGHIVLHCAGNVTWLDFSSSPPFGIGVAVCLLCQGFGVCKGELREKLHRHCLCLPAAHQRIHLEKI